MKRMSLPEMLDLEGMQRGVPAEDQEGLCQQLPLIASKEDQTNSVLGIRDRAVV